MSDYIDGELDLRTAARVKRHVRWCPNCRRMLANLTRTVRALGRLAERTPPGEQPQAKGAPPIATRDHQTPAGPGWREALKVVARPEHLRSTLATALIVGTILFAINQLNVVLAGHATTIVWLKVGLTYLVPFTVSNVGILIATRARDAGADDRADDRAAARAARGKR